MAGGIGSRFWPRSRTACPKQFLDILGTGRTLLQQTWDRFSQICPKKNIYIVSGTQYKDLIKQQLPEVAENNVLLEPMRRNTAPCIAYACYKIMARNPLANIVVSPSDHYIGDLTGFIKTIEKGLEFTATNNSLLTIGIKPTRPETGYGYIQIDGSNNENPLEINQITKVKTFTEKPILEMAKTFLETKEFFWNSGIFIWNVQSLVMAMKAHQPDIDILFSAGKDIYNTPKETEFINKIYSECTSISIDNGIMECAPNVYVIPAQFPWSDLGTWGSLYENSTKDINGNVIAGTKVFAENTNGCIISSSDAKLMIVNGLKDYIVAEADGMILIIPKKDEQSIKNIVNEVKINLGNDYV